MKQHTLPDAVGWYPWRKLACERLVEPRHVHYGEGGVLCVTVLKEVAVPVEEIGGFWGKRIGTLEPRRD